MLWSKPNKRCQKDDTYVRYLLWSWSIASKINCNDNHFSQFLSEPKQNAMFLIPTNEHEILKMVKTLKSKKSSGYDGISTKLLKTNNY